LVHFLRGKQTADLFSLSSLSQETFLFEFSRPVPVACEVLYQGGADFFSFSFFPFFYSEKQKCIFVGSEVTLYT